MLLSLCLGGCGGNSPAGPTPSACSAVTTPTSVELRPGVSFRVDFTVPPGVTTDIVLFSFLGLSRRVNGQLVHRLYDGTTLLGSQEVQTTVAGWKSAESSYGTPDSGYEFSSPVVTIDFRSIVNGTIAGRVEISVTSGSVVLDSIDEAAVLLMGPLSRGSPTQRSVPITRREICR